MRLPVGLLLILICTVSCGKRGALIYPEMVAPTAPAEVTALQSGSEVKISLLLPQKDLAGRPLRELAGFKLFKQVTDATKEGACKACSSEALLAKTVFFDHPGTAVQRYDNRFILLDSQVHSGIDYVYYVQSFLQDGTNGVASLPVTVSVVPVLAPPALKAVPEPTEVRLELAAPSPAPGTFVGFSIYRAIKGQPFPYRPLTKEPVVSRVFSDFGLQRQLMYTYVAKTIVRLPNGALAESAASDTVEVQLSED